MKARRPRVEGPDGSDRMGAALLHTRDRTGSRLGTLPMGVGMEPSGHRELGGKPACTLDRAHLLPFPMMALGTRLPPPPPDFALLAPALGPRPGPRRDEGDLGSPGGREPKFMLMRRPPPPPLPPPPRPGGVLGGRTVSDLRLRSSRDELLPLFPRPRPLGPSNHSGNLGPPPESRSPFLGPVSSPPKFGLENGPARLVLTRSLRVPLSYTPLLLEEYFTSRPPPSDICTFVGVFSLPLTRKKQTDADLRRP